MVLRRRMSALLLCMCMLIVFSSCKKQESELVEPATVAIAAPTEETSEEVFSFSYDPNMQVSYSEVDFSGEKVQIHTTEMILSEEEGRSLVDQLNQYKNSIGGNVLKSEFYTYYTVSLNAHTSFVIDANCENYSRDVSYMFVNLYQNGKMKQYGTYVDVSLISFLEEKVRG